MRGHTPVVIDEFNGFFARGDAESCPADHFTDCNNIKYIQTGFETRDGINTYLPYSNVVRVYNFIHAGVEGLLVLDSAGDLYHSASPTPFVPILSIPAMTDFAFIGIADRAYISPHDGNLGLEDEFVYVYLGDGAVARKAAGLGPVGGSFSAANSGTSGNVEAGIHLFGVVYETNTGYLTQIGDVIAQVTVPAPGNKKVDLSNIPTSPSSFVVARHIVATVAIDPSVFTGDTSGYEFFFVPDGRIDNNTATTLSINFYDADLIDDASHLEDLLSEIPAGVNLTTYHGRMVVLGIFGEYNANVDLNTLANISLAYLSFAGEPEAINAVDGLIQAPITGTPLTNAQEYRDILYLFKQTQTGGYVDNGNAPATWVGTVIDQGIGASIHGIASVLDSGGINVDWLIMADYSGIMLFNGAYQRPELSWKIKDFWFNLSRDFFKNIQIMNDSLSQIFYITLPDARMLIGDYSNALNPTEIRWGKWSFDIDVSTITLIEKNKLIIGSRGFFP